MFANLFRSCFVGLLIVSAVLGKAAPGKKQSDYPAPVVSTALVPTMSQRPIMDALACLGKLLQIV
jgi:hypothetical protein